MRRQSDKSSPNKSNLERESQNYHSHSSIDRTENKFCASNLLYGGTNTPSSFMVVAPSHLVEVREQTFINSYRTTWALSSNSRFAQNRCLDAATLHDQAFIKCNIQPARKFYVMAIPQISSQTTTLIACHQAQL